MEPSVTTVISSARVPKTLSSSDIRSIVRSLFTLVTLVRTCVFINVRASPFLLNGAKIRIIFISTKGRSIC